MRRGQIASPKWRVERAGGGREDQKVPSSAGSGASPVQACGKREGPDTSGRRRGMAGIGFMIWSRVMLVVVALVVLVVLANVLMAVLPLVLAVLGAAVPVGLAVLGILSCLGSEKGTNVKLLWVLVMVLAPILGPLLWFFGGGNTPES